MNPPGRLMSTLVGFGVGLMLGALIFYISGSMKLALAMVLMVVFCIIGGMVGFNFQRILRWVRADSVNIEEEGSGVGVLSDRDFLAKVKLLDQRSKMEESQIYWETTWENLKGMLPQEYRGDTKRFATIVAVDVLVGLGFITLELYLGIVVLKSFMYMFIVIGLTILSSALYQFARWFSIMDAVVNASAFGLNYSSGRKSWQLSWHEIAETWERNEKHTVNEITVRNIHEVKLLTRTDNEFKVDRRLRDFHELANIIQTAVTSHLLPDAIQTLQSGGTLDFSRWAFSNQGIQWKEKLMTWADIKKIVIYQAKIQIRCRGKKWFNFAEAKAWELPNFPLFFTISRYYTDVEMPTRPTFAWEE